MLSQRAYIASVIILIIVCIVLIAGLLHFRAQSEQAKSSKTESDVCMTKDCALTAAMLISAMDSNVDPCDDFYKFSCGNFIEKNPVRHDETSFTVDDLFYKYFELQLAKLVEDWNSYGEPNVVFRMQEAYHVCFNATYQREKELRSFQNFTQNILNWPLMTENIWIPKFKFVGQYLAMFEEMGLHNPLINIRIVYDKGNDRYLVLLSPPQRRTLEFRTYSNPQWENEHVSNHNKDMLLKIIHLLGNNDNKLIDDQLNRVIDLAFYFHNEDEGIPEDEMPAGQEDENYTSNNINSATNNNNDDDTEGFMTFDELFNFTDRKINWLNIANKKMHKSVLNRHDLVYASDLDYFKILTKAVKKFSLRRFVNFFGLEILFAGLVKHVSPDVDSILKQYISATEIYDSETVINKSFRDEPRWLFCLGLMKNTFNLVLTRLFIQKYINTNEKQSADKMVQLIQEAYKQNILSSNWLDEPTKEAAIKKADKIKRFVGYPDLIFDNALLDEAYKHVLPQVKSTHLENYLAFLEVNSEENIEQKDDIKAELQTWKWDSSPLKVNAFYSPSKNSVWFPFARLQLPYFQDSRLAAVNFGMMGSVIGHEIGHAFDNEGSKRNEYGIIHNWWTKKTREIFENKSTCFVYQYSRFCIESLQGDDKDYERCVDGRQTLGENLADNTGLNAAYLAYKLWVKEHGPDKRLPGLDIYTPDHIFFISFANAWCENIPPDKWVKRYLLDAHSAAHYRVIGAVANSKGFRDVFNCPRGPMNHGEYSCTVW